jgi:hypothetical protein
MHPRGVQRLLVPPQVSKHGAEVAHDAPIVAQRSAIARSK